MLFVCLSACLDLIVCLFSFGGLLVCLRVCLIARLPVSKALSQFFEGISFSLFWFIAPAERPFIVTVVAISSSSVPVDWIKLDKGALHNEVLENRRVQ